MYFSYYNVQLFKAKRSSFTYPKWPTFPLLCCAVAVATVSLSGWMLSSVLHIFVARLCSNHDWHLSRSELNVQQELNKI